MSKCDCAPKWINVKKQMPERGVLVLVRYLMPWPSETITVQGALCDEVPDLLKGHLFWFNGRGESMRGQVTHWMPMIDIEVDDGEETEG